MPKAKNENKTKVDSLEKLEKTIKAVDKKMGRAISLKFTFIKGLVAGVGTAIGATIIAAIVIAVLAKVVSTLNEIPILDQIIEKTRLEEAIESINSTDE